MDDAIAEADEVLRSFDPDRLLDKAVRSAKPATVMEVIGLQVAHYATHTGQIAYAAKLLTDDAIDDIWRKTPTH